MVFVAAHNPFVAARQAGSLFFSGGSCVLFCLIFIYLFMLAVPGLSCSMWDLLVAACRLLSRSMQASKSRHADILVAACRLLVVARGLLSCGLQTLSCGLRTLSCGLQT